uniref:Mediator of RNA polymerase II transcription subunit 24 n=1 Tax=Anopheles stephensi TaxID=30069 RepID=A0A182Y2W0_ANOST
MIMDNSKTTSKTTLLKLMLLRAWKERWTDCQWGINVKTILTRGVSGDVYNLADAIVQQAVVGSGANMLFLSYLKHSLCAHLISHAAVLNRIAKYDQFDKHHCLIALLDFLKSIIDGVTCRGKQEESILTKATVALVHWLLQIYECILKAYADSRALQTEEEDVVQRVAIVLERIVENPFLLGVLSIGKCEDPDLFLTLQKRFNGINNLTITTGYVAHVGSSPKNVTVTDYMRKLVLLEVDILEMKQFDGGKVEPITFSLQPFIAIEVLLNPMTDTNQNVAQLITLKRLKGYSYARLYCEIMRGCLISLNNVEGTSKESLLCAFAFIKVPHILHQIHTKTNGKEQQDEATSANYSVDLVEAFELLLQDAPVLDYMDMKCSCNIVECLLKEMVKHHLLTETHVKHFVALRDPVTVGLHKLEANNAHLTLMLKFVFRVESPLVGILKALSADYSKVQDALLAMLCQVLTGNSLDLIVSVASVEGKFKTFIAGLLKCNDYAKQTTSVEIGKASTTRGALFDVTFMILACIAQSYGSDVILAEGGNSFFEKWVRDYMVERKKSKSPMTMVKQADPMVLEELIMALNSSNDGGGGLKGSNLRWEDICYTIPALLHQVLMAWENEKISPVEIKKMLDGLKAHFCSFAVCASSWLCAYMQMVRQDEQVKPMNMVQQLCSVLAGPQAEEWQQQDYCKERFGLMGQIIRRMQQEFQRTPQINPKLRALFPSQHMVSHLPLEEQFEEAWKAIVERGWLPIETTFLLDTLLQSCGPSWLVEKLIAKLFLCKYIRDLNKTMDIVFAIMHLDVERCTIALLSQLVPMMLQNKQQTPEIVDPQSRVLAKLCVYCIIVTMEASITASKKRTRATVGSELEDIDSLCTSAKLRKIELDGMGVGCEATGGNDFALESALDSVASWDGASVPSLKEPLQGCLQTLFRTFTQYITTDELSPKVYFIFQFLSLLVESGRDRIACVLKLLPNGLYDLNTPTGRQCAMSDVCLLRNIQMRKESIKL